MNVMDSWQAMKHLPSPFPHQRLDEHEAIEPLRQVRSLANIIANLLLDAQIARDSEENDRADYYERLAREAADSMLTVAEDAVKAMPNNERDKKIQEQA
jgi:hypothetical protein